MFDRNRAAKLSRLAIVHLKDFRVRLLPRNNVTAEDAQVCHAVLTIHHPVARFQQQFAGWLAFPIELADSGVDAVVQEKLPLVVDVEPARKAAPRIASNPRWDRPSLLAVESPALDLGTDHEVELFRR